MSEDGACYELTKRVLKLFCIIIVFLLLLASTLVSKGTLLYATSNIYADNTKYVKSGHLPTPSLTEHFQFPLMCLDYKIVYNRSSNIITNHTNCVAVNNMSHAVQYGCLVPNNRTGQVQITRGPYNSEICHYVPVLWAWCLTLIMCTPYVFTLLKCLWSMAFKMKKTPTLDVVVFVSMWHCLATVS